ncbi:serine hydrolase [Paenibacillus sp. KR2-11]
MLPLMVALSLGTLTLPADRVCADPDGKGMTPAQEAEAFADRFFEKPEVNQSLAGAVVVIVQDGEVVLQKGYGYADLEKKTPADPEKTVYRMASLSKPVTATALMQLAEQGKIDLEGDVQDYLGGLSVPNRTGEPLRVKHLLTHTTGFDYTDRAGTLTGPLSLEAYIRTYMPTVIRRPGEAYRYDNFASALQGYIVQRVSGQGFGAYVKDHIFSPLGMANSDFVLTPQLLPKLAPAYDSRNRLIPPYEVVPTEMPEGGMLSTGADMARFMVAHLNGGQLGGARILRKETAASMHTFQKAIHPDIPQMTYGFESFIHQYHNGQRVISKGGDIEGYHSWMWLLPDHRSGGFIVYNNEVSELRVPFFQAYMDHYYPLRGGGAEEKEAPASQEMLKRLEGRYQELRSPSTLYTVKAEDGRLTVRDSSGSHTLKGDASLLFHDEEGVPAAFREEGTGETYFYSSSHPSSWARKLREPEPYQDVPESDPDAGAIYLLRQLGAFGDEGQTRFRPDETLTRAEFTAMLVRLSGLQPSKEPPAFKDTAGSPYAAQIQSAYEMGVVQGEGPGIFAPEQPLTRLEAVSILARHAEGSPGEGEGAPPVAGKAEEGAGGDAAGQPESAATPPEAWAEQGVRFATAAGLWPAAAREEAAQRQWLAQPMSRRQAAAMIGSLLLQRMEAEAWAALLQV